MERTIVLHQGLYQEPRNQFDRLADNRASSTVQSLTISAASSNTVAEAALQLHAIIIRGFVRPYIDESTRSEFANAIRLGLDGR
ncbi:hypothetical protein AX760_25475 [Pararhizobium antarcticum]|uniref:Uncharacterized protein n=1 Tax=Pararhizobium antarcticum TaxID=1798805 RepID=A0A657LX20_9HYPH|nr:hypothetical protein AX760_25475 [Pararhizobium antarcticum]OJG00662.1 hypothetical protein AX761_24485 [Rhizobium sp. 58]